jgi:hypothetical protein
MSKSLAVDVLSKYLRLSPADYLLLERAFQVGVPRQPGSEMSAKGLNVGNVSIGYANGVTLRNPITGTKSIDLQPDGDAFFGYNIDVPEHSSLRIFSTAQTYNKEKIYRGDLLIGDNSDDKANILYDASEGTLNFRKGTDTKLYLDTLGELTLSGAIRSSNFEGGIAGFQILADGDAEFNNVMVRGTLQSTVFKYSEIQVTAGTTIVALSGSRLYSAATTVASPTTFIVRADNSDAGASLFTTSSRLRCKTWDGSNIQDIWMTVSSMSNQGTYSRYNCVLESGSAGVTIPIGTAIVDYGPSGTGNITLSADGAVGASANINIATHAGTPWATQFSVARLGNLNGVLGIAATTYGFACGDLSNGSVDYFKATTAGVELISGGGECIIDSSGISLFAGTSYLSYNSYKILSGATTVLELRSFVNSLNIEGQLNIHPIAGKDSKFDIYVNCASGETSSVILRADYNASKQAGIGLYSNATSCWAEIGGDWVTLNGYARAPDGIHVGGTSDPGTDNLIVDGDVSIGTTSAAYKLRVHDDTANSIAYFLNDGNSTTRTGIAIQCGADDGAGQNLPINIYDGNGTYHGSVALLNSNVEFIQASDVSRKENIQDTQFELDKFMGIKVRDFTWKKGGHANKGVIAQELMEVYPEYVGVSGITGEMVIYPMRFIPELISAVQSLQHELDSLKEETA